MTTLPKFVVLQSKYNNKYLQIVHQDGDLHGFLQFSGDQVVSPYTKLQVEVSQSDNNLVHLRSCFNNKYWVASSQHDTWILADSDEPEEDQAKLSCTLFRPTFVDAETVSFMHVNLGKFVTLMDQPGQARDACLYPLSSESQNQDLTDVFTVVDWSSLVILPRNVAFKGGPDGKYLSALPVNDIVRYLQFVADDLSDPTVGHEVFTTTDANITLKSDHYQKFWTRTTSSWVLADTAQNDVGSNDNTLFSPTKIQQNIIVLKSIANNDYCKSISANDVTTGEPIIALSAADATITKLSHLEVVERVVSRHVNVEVSDVRVSHVRVVEPFLVALAAGEVINNATTAVEMVVKLVYYGESLTRVWDSTVNGSLTVGVTVDINSPIPVEVNGQIVMTGGLMGDMVWGVGEAKSQSPAEVAYKVAVPAKTKATVKAMGRRRLWDVPFSYTQTNTLVDGTKTSSKMDDGIYTGTHTLFEDYEVELTPIG